MAGLGDSLSRLRLNIDTSRLRDREENSPVTGAGSGGGGGGGNGENPGSQPMVSSGGGMNGAGGGQGANLAQDSLSLMQLKRLVGEGGRIMQPEYAYQYTTTEGLAAELNEWFSYSSADLSLIIGGAKTAFDAQYRTLSLQRHGNSLNDKIPKWTTSKDIKRRRFISRCVELLEQADQEERVRGLECLSFVVQGSFGEMRDQEEQVHWIRRNVKLVRKTTAAVEGVYNCLRNAVGREWNFVAASATAPQTNGSESDETLSKKALNRRELRQALTILYFLIEVTRQESVEGTQPAGFDEELELFRDEVAQLPGEAGLLGFLVKNVSRMRWEDNADLPLTNMLLLAWKVTLLLFGEHDRHLPKVKTFARLAEGLSSEVDKAMITASPLDYHLFRQDIIAKYPAYNPPKPLFQFETNSFLPSLAENSTIRTGGNHDVLLGGKGGEETLANILDKVVHIATPAPSPPPSPGGAGGKGGKKQNYQTNQSFPLLYPADDGGAELDRKFGGWWKDTRDACGVPTSIREAGELFQGRIRTTLGMRQLWKEREAFLKFNRGWEVGEMEGSVERRAVDEGRVPRWEEKRLAVVEEFYKTALPHLQSFVIVLFKVILANVTAASMTQQTQPPPPPPPPPNTFDDRDDSRDPNGPKSIIVDPATGEVDFAQSASANSLKKSWSLFGRSRKESDALGTIGEETPASPQPDSEEWRREQERQRVERENEEQKRWAEADSVRQREIKCKAVTALLVIFLKWFRVSHILKFEYFTQLLLDSNYIPLVLKLLNTQDMVATVTARTDHAERTYFRVCNLHSIAPTPLYTSASTTSSSSPDDACPPPIARFRSGNTAAASSSSSPPSNSSPGLPGDGDIPSPTITDFSPRAFFSLINIMRVLQKIVKGKAHRNLALVQYKSSAILRKPLKCPQTELRLYTLKVFKGQVPYCGRKWRQSNMRVITSIYLYCRPELRDDWLAGSDVDQEVEDALPQEQALRALTHFFNIRRYPKSMGADSKLLEEEQDFFRRELERMEGAGPFGTDESPEDEAAGGAAWAEGEGWS